MKKKLVVLLAAVMLFAFSANAYAASFSDVSDQSVIVQDAIKKTVALGIIEGYEDGTFGPDKTITRAEFAKIAVSAAGAEQTAAMLEGNNSSFKDVKAGAWYTGWINASESLGIFLGDTNGNFRPNDTITNQEAITVMLRLLGYNDNLTGTWPVNYVTKANQLKLLDDVNIVANAAAKRGDIVVILDDLLDTYIVTYDKDTNEFVYKQTKISDSDWIRLIDDSFDGEFVDVGDFNKVEQVRDAASKTLTWTVGNENFIIDEQTAVSYNGGSIFDLEHHQGKVYFVKDNNDKKYARFIEVESYTTTTTDDVVYNGNKVSVKKTNYNVAPDWTEYDSDGKRVGTHRGVIGKNVSGNITYLDKSDEGLTWTVAAKDDTKKWSVNSNTILYFNDDDQVYRIAGDKEYSDKSYIVKGVNTNNVRLVGTNNKTVSMNDGDTLIYDGDKFISPSDLEVGDAIVEVNAGELYYMINTITGELNSTDRGDNNDDRYKVDGKNYVAAPSGLWLDEDYEDSGVATEDVIGNKITILLNKDNTVAVALVDETSTGTTLYGIVCDDNTSTGSFNSGSTSGLTIFTEEGNRVYYDLDDDFTPGSFFTKSNLYGRLVAYKLNKNGEIKDLDLIIQHEDNNIKDDTEIGNQTVSGTDVGLKGYSFDLRKHDGEIEVKNNAYLNFGDKSLALASNVIIFEVDKDGNGKIDVDLVTRSALLNKSDFKPEQVTINSQVRQYFAYDTNSNGAVKAVAYTTASSNDLHYGIVDAWNYRSSDYDHSVTIKGDDTVYELHQSGGSYKGGAGQLIAYELSGDNLTPIYNFKKNGDEIDTREVSGITNGLISFKQIDSRYGLGEVRILRDYRLASGTGTSKVDYQPNLVYDVMTDTNTLVYVIDATSGTYAEGSLGDISRGDYVYVPVIDSDGYADIVIVDEYGNSAAALEAKKNN